MYLHLLYEIININKMKGGFIINILEEISTFLQQGRAPKVKALVEQAIRQNVNAQDILEQGLLVGMSIIDEKFKNNMVFVPEVLVAVRAMNKGIEVLRPYLLSHGVESKGTVVLGAVKGDLPGNGKNLVKIMMEGKGLKVIDLGVDVPVVKYLEAAKENSARIIACAALPTTTMEQMRDVVKAVKTSELAAFVKVIMIGGAPVTQNFADSIGADMYAADAATAAADVLSLCVG